MRLNNNLVDKLFDEIDKLQEEEDWLVPRACVPSVRHSSCSCNVPLLDDIW